MTTILTGKISRKATADEERAIAKRCKADGAKLTVPVRIL
jgi:hypothetical protein